MVPVLAAAVMPARWLAPWVLALCAILAVFPGRRVCAQEGNIFGPLGEAITWAQNGYRSVPAKGPDGFPIPLKDASGNQLYDLEGLPRVVMVKEHFTAEERYSMAQDAKNFINRMKETHPEIYARGAERRFPQDLAKLDKVLAEQGAELDARGIPRPAPTAYEPQRAASNAGRGDAAASSSGARGGRGPADAAPSPAADGAARSANKTADIRPRGDAGTRPNSTLDTRPSPAADGAARSANKTADIRPRGDAGTRPNSTLDTRPSPAADGAARDARATLDTRPPAPASGPSRAGGSPASSSSYELPLLDPDNPQAAPRIENGRVVGTQQAGSASAEENARREFFMKKDGTVIPGKANPADNIRPGETIVQVDPLTGKRTFLHDDGVPKNQRKGIEERMNRELDAKINQAIDERQQQLARIKEQSDNERARMARERAATEEDLPPRKNAAAAPRNEGAATAPSEGEGAAGGRARNTQSNAPRVAEPEPVAGASRPAAGPTGQQPAAEGSPAGTSAESGAPASGAPGTRAKLIEAAREAGKRGGLAGLIVMAADAYAKGMEAGLDDNVAGPVEFVKEAAPAMVVGGVVATVKTGLGALGGAALGFVLSLGNPGGAILGAKIGGSAVALWQVGEGAVAAGERLGQARARADLRADEERFRNLGAGRDSGGPLKGNASADLSPELPAPGGSKSAGRQGKTAAAPGEPVLDDESLAILARLAAPPKRLRGSSLNEFADLVLDGLTVAANSDSQRRKSREEAALEALLNQVEGQGKKVTPSRPTVGATVPGDGSKPPAKGDPPASLPAKSTTAPAAASASSAAKAAAGAAAATTSTVGVPGVVGHDLESAARTLKAAGLVATPVEVKKKPDNVKPRVVFGQQPAEGTQVAAGASVEVYYSVGPPASKTLKVPALLRKTKEEAEKELAKVKLTAKATAGDRKPTRSNKRHEVYSQTPSVGTEVKEGDTVAFEYLAGIKVGRYNGMKKDAAFKAIEAAGFDAQVSEGDLVTKNISERATVYDQSPKPEEYRWFGDVVKAWYYKSAEGFQKEDGALVDARFAEPTITDGDVPGIGGKAAGKLSAIYFFKSGGAKEKQTGIGWAIKRFENGSDARAFIAEKSKDGLFQMKNLSVGGTTIRANHQIAGDHANASSHVTTPQGQISSHLNMVIYKDRFLIYFTHIVPDASHDFAKESSRIVQKSKEAIDARFPDD